MPTNEARDTCERTLIDYIGKWVNMNYGYKEFYSYLGRKIVVLSRFVW